MPGTPCARGHSYERRGPHGCRDCNAARKRGARRAQGSAEWNAQKRANKRYRADWIVASHEQLSHRSRGQPRASIRELRALWERQKGRCALTGLPVERPHLDHIVPAAAGGAHTIDNLQWVHPTANHAKNGSTVEEFRAWLLAAADALRQKMRLEALL